MKLPPRAAGMFGGEVDDSVSDDLQLVRRCLAGEALALRDFVQRFQGVVFGVCLRMLGHQQDAEDVAQETLLRAVRHLRHWDGARPLIPWVLTIAVNRCRTHLSRSKKIARPSEVPDEAVAKPQRVDAGDLGEELQRALGTLREEYRTCFILFHQQELSLQEVAEILDCPVGTVKTWLHRARKELAEWLRQRGVVNEVGYEL